LDLEAQVWPRLGLVGRKGDGSAHWFGAMNGSWPRRAANVAQQVGIDASQPRLGFGPCSRGPQQPTDGHGGGCVAALALCGAAPPLLAQSQRVSLARRDPFM
jgi:hypothetical protein